MQFPMWGEAAVGDGGLWVGRNPGFSHAAHQVARRQETSRVEWLQGDDSHLDEGQARQRSEVAAHSSQRFILVDVDPYKQLPYPKQVFSADLRCTWTGACQCRNKSD